MDLSQVYSLSRSLFISHVLINSKRQEDEHLSHLNRWQIVWTQAEENFYFHIQCRFFDEATNLSTATQYPFWSLCLANPALQLTEVILNRHIKELSRVSLLWTRDTVAWINRRVGSLYQIAAVVSCLATIYFGGYAVGSISLAILAFGYLERYRIIPLQISKLYRQSLAWVGLTAGLTSGIYLIQGLCAVGLVAKIYSHFFGKPAPVSYDEEPPHTPALTWEKFQLIKQGKPLEPTNHVSIQTFPNYSTTNFQALKDFIQKFSWDDEEARKAWNKIILNQEQPEKNSPPIDPLKIEKMRQMILMTIETVEHESIFTLNQVNYRAMRNYLGYIEHALPNAGPYMQAATLLCLRNITDQTLLHFTIASAAQQLLRYSLLGKNENLRLRQVILFLLQERRERIVQERQDEDENVVQNLKELHGDFGSIHLKNLYHNIVAPQFGLLDKGQKTDPRAQPLSFSPICFKTGIVNCFDFYDSELILNAIMMSHYLEIEDVKKWALEWANKNPISANEWIAFIEELERIGNSSAAESNKADSKEMDESSAAKKDPVNLDTVKILYKAMLVDMGILKLVES